MCGIGGYIHKSECSTYCVQIENIVHSNQACRGPDNQSSWTSTKENVTVHFFHQRLRIQDLSESADQPMHSNLNSSTHVVFNGEIYNATKVKDSLLSDVTLKTHADTEVLVEALATHKTVDVLKATRGMFAIGNYNSTSQTLELIRDYFGEKPIHYTFNDDFILLIIQNQ
jgi:asparagine synthase (glutamine-hydrolysing)